MILSVIIPAYNENRVLGGTLDNLIHVFQDAGIGQNQWEIIVCDNNSTDQTPEIAKKFGANVIFEPENQISKARNSGAKIAQGKWFLFMDADTYPDVFLIKEIFSLIKEDKVIGCGVTVKVVDGSLFNKLRMERLNPIFRLFNLAGGAFILSQKSGFTSVNGFSENLFAYEDIDFVIRLKHYGKSVHRKFKVLSKNPVHTSGRKGEMNFKSVFRLVFSNFFAVLLFLFSYILPSKIIRKLGKKLLGYWYMNK